MQLLVLRHWRFGGGGHVLHIRRLRLSHRQLSPSHIRVLRRLRNFDLELDFEITWEIVLLLGWRGLDEYPRWLTVVLSEAFLFVNLGVEVVNDVGTVGV